MFLNTFTGIKKRSKKFNIEKMGRKNFVSILKFVFIYVVQRALWSACRSISPVVFFQEDIFLVA